jgi:hypothetical protein
VSDLRGLIKREIKGRQQFIVGKILSLPSLVNFEVTAAPRWVVDVDIGANRPLRRVPIKGGSDGQRFYANLGQTVLLRRNAFGRYEVVSQGDRVTGDTSSFKTYTLDDPNAKTSSSLGFRADPVTFIFYANIGDPGNSRWADGTTPFPLVRVLDGAGNPV